MSSATRQYIKAFVAGSAIIGTGVVLFNTTVPTDEELIAKFSPEVRAEYERNKSLRQEEQRELAKIVQKTAASNDPIWKTGPIKSPFEKEGRGVDPKLVNAEKFHQDKANEFKRNQVQDAEKEYLEAEALIKQQGKKSWYKFW